MSHSYAYARPALAADVVLFGAAEDELEVLLIERGGAPFLGCPALPGGFVRVDEDLEAAVRRELAEEAGVSPGWLQQLQTFGRVDRDPRERVVTVAYWALAPPRQPAGPGL
jgi:8-oxo-dGTP diphosphatase